MKHAEWLRMMLWAVLYAGCSLFIQWAVFVILLTIPSHLTTLNALQVATALLFLWHISKGMWELANDFRKEAKDSLEAQP